MEKSISVVIPNYNGRHLLEANLPSVYEALKSSSISDYEVIVADDHSHDDSCDFIKSSYPEVLLIEGDRNLGFSGNMNRGIFVATKDLVLLLNSDVTLTDEYFKPCLRYFEIADTFGVMGKIVSPDNSIQDGAKYPEIDGLKIKGTINYRINDDPPELIPTFFLSGANALIDREKIHELGGFDEIFSPYYSEDVELSIRAWRHGYRCYFEPKAECIHPISSTILKEKKSKVDIIRRRNRFIIHYLHLDNPSLIAWIFLNRLKWLYHRLMNNRNYIESYRQFIELKSDLRQKRLDINESSKFKLSEVRRMIIQTLEPFSITKFRI